MTYTVSGGALNSTQLNSFGVDGYNITTTCLWFDRNIQHYTCVLFDLQEQQNNKAFFGSYSYITQ